MFSTKLVVQFENVLCTFSRSSRDLQGKADQYNGQGKQNDMNTSHFIK